ncbi:hypothetical protein GN958_ATG01373, partial [Phytophthora infestans]
MGSFFFSDLSTATAIANKLNCLSLGVKTLSAMELHCKPVAAAPADSVGVRPCRLELELPLNFRLLQSFANPSQTGQA